MRFSALGLLLCGALASSASPAAAADSVSSLQSLKSILSFAKAGRADALVSMQQLLKTRGTSMKALAGEDDGEVCGTCEVEGGMDTLLQVAQANYETWQRTVDSVPYGALTKTWGDEFKFEKRPDLPRWVVVGANHEVHSTEIYEKMADGTEVYTPDEQEGASVETMYWFISFTAQCLNPMVKVCSRFDEKTGAMTHLSTRIEKAELTIDVVGRLTVGKEVCEKMCTEDYKPVCGSDNKTYSNVCFLDVARCLDSGYLSLAYEGECKNKPKMKQAGETFLA